MATASVGRRREFQAVGLIGAGHFMSHLYQLALPPLFLMMKADLAVGFVELGGAVALYSIVTAVLQTPVGFVVDRIGGRWLLIAGLFVNAAAIYGVGSTSSYGVLLGLMAAAGVGNSVFHPADFAILSASVDRRRLGRAYSVHAFGGSAGFMAAPVATLALAALWDWRTALEVLGLAGMALAAVMALLRGAMREQSEAAPDAAGAGKAAGPGWRALLTRTTLMFFFFHVASASAGGGLSAFSIVALVEIYGVDEPAAGAVLTLYFGTVAICSLIGGFVADRMRRHDLILIVAFAIGAVGMAAIGTAALPFWLVGAVFVLIGMMRGVVNPARDVLVRRAAPAGAVGLVFGFVTTGFNVGGGIAPVVYGWAMDTGSAESVFWLAAGFTLVGIAIVAAARERALYAQR